MAMENKELIEKVKLLQEQALEDNRLCLAELFGNILNAEKDCTSLSDYFISIADDVSEDLVRFYLFLFQLDVEDDWYYTAQVIFDDAGNFKKYEKSLKKCAEMRMSAGEVFDIFDQYRSAEEFEDKINEIIAIRERQPETAPLLNEDPQNDISRILEENKNLAEHNESLRNQMSDIFDKYKDALQQSASSKQLITKLKIDYDHAEKTRKRAEAELRINQNKIKKNEQLISSLKQMNRKLAEELEMAQMDPGVDEESYQQIEKENENLRQQLVSTEMKLSEAQEERKRLQEENSDLKSRLEADREENVAVPEEITIENLPPEEDLMEVDQSFEEESQSNEPIIEERPMDWETPEQIGEELPVCNNSSEVVRHMNIFAKLFAKHYERAFEKATEVNQINIINSKILEKGLDIEKAMVVRNYISNRSIPKLEIYRLIMRNASMEEFMQLKQTY